MPSAGTLAELSAASGRWVPATVTVPSRRRSASRAMPSTPTAATVDDRLSPLRS
jgi:hypothetical protein